MGGFNRRLSCSPWRTSGMRIHPSGFCRERRVSSWLTSRLARRVHCTDQHSTTREHCRWKRGAASSRGADTVVWAGGGACSDVATPVRECVQAVRRGDGPRRQARGGCHVPSGTLSPSRPRACAVRAAVKVDRTVCGVAWRPQGLVGRRPLPGRRPAVRTRACGERSGGFAGTAAPINPPGLTVLACSGRSPATPRLARAGGRGSMWEEG